MDLWSVSPGRAPNRAEAEAFKALSGEIYLSEEASAREGIRLVVRIGLVILGPIMDAMSSLRDQM